MKKSGSIATLISSLLLLNDAVAAEPDRVAPLPEPAEHPVQIGIFETECAGPDSPVADNGTEAGRQKNRRIEFAILP